MCSFIFIISHSFYSFLFFSSFLIIFILFILFIHSFSFSLFLLNNYELEKKSDNSKFSAFGGLDSLLSISEMPTGSPVVTVGINKSANAAIYALKILANHNSVIKRKLKKHKFDQHSSVLKESDELKKLGLAKFVKKKFK